MDVADLRILIAGGGTAGHVLPGLAVADALVHLGVDRESITWVGAARGLETQLVPEAGYRLVALPGRGIQRRLTADNLRSAAGLASAMARSASVVRRAAPDVVLTLGGYASVGPALAAAFLRIPVIVAEQNARAGAANRIMGRVARACAVPFVETDLPRKVITGNPVRAEILAHRDDDAAARQLARSQMGWPDDRIVIAVFAGSLGSRRINEAIIELATRWAGDGRLHVHHVVGRRDHDELEPPDIGSSSIGYQRVPYEDRMELVLAGCDLAVCRAGGTTVAELAVIGVPALLVPLPIATRDHQRANAEPLRVAGAALVVSDDEFDADRLERELRPLVDSSERRTAMARAAHLLGRPGAASAVADLVLRTGGAR